MKRKERDRERGRGDENSSIGQGLLEWWWKTGCRLLPSAGGIVAALKQSIPFARAGEGERAVIIILLHSSIIC